MIPYEQRSAKEAAKTTDGIYDDHGDDQADLPGSSKNYLTLKWGTLKSWNFAGNAEAISLLRRYNEIGSQGSAMMQHDTPEQKEIICQMIDLMPGTIHLDWDGVDVSREEAKQYVRNYGKR